MAAIDRPGLAVFANNADAEDALQADHVAADLLLESSVPVVSTSQKRGFLYGFALATNAAVKRSERRDAAGLARSRPIGFDRLLASMAPHLSLEEAQPRSTAVREPARAVLTGPQAARPSQPTPPVAAVGGPTTYPSTLNGQGDGNGSASGTLSAQPGGQIASSANQPALERRASALRRLISALRPADRPSPGGGGQGPAASDR
jgi:hypothetical protein